MSKRFSLLMAYSHPTHDDSDALNSFLKIENLDPRYKSAWVKAAQRDGKKLAVWVIDTLNAAAGDAQSFPKAGPQPPRAD